MNNSSFDQNTVSKDNKIIGASYRLTLSEQRLLLACISQIDSRRSLSADTPISLSSKDFACCYDISEDRAYSELKTITDRLFNRYVVIRDPDPDNPALEYTRTRWVSSIDYIPRQSVVRLYFAPKIIPFLSALKREFTTYKLAFVARMTSTYAIRLYELLVQWGSVGEREIELSWLRQQFQIEDKYKALKDLKRRVLEPAAADINEHSNYWVSWTQRKTGRRVTHLRFLFGAKEKKKSDAPHNIPSGDRVMGVSREEIERLARPGETWGQAADRITRERAANKNL